MRWLSRQELRQLPRLFEISCKENPTLRSICLFSSCHLNKRFFDRKNHHRIASFSFTVYQILKLKHRSISSTSQKRPAHDAKRLECAWAASQPRGAPWVLINMADTGTQQAHRKVVMPTCDHQALKECLDRNNGDRSKCMKEWEDFQRSCAENKRWLCWK